MPRRIPIRVREERFPPILIRLCITRGRGKERHAPTDQQLANACGLTMAEFKFVSYSTAWRDVSDRLKRAFLTGCDIDLEKRRCWRRLDRMAKSGFFSHLRRSPLFEVQFREMLDIYADAQ